MAQGMPAAARSEPRAGSILAGIGRALRGVALLLAFSPPILAASPGGATSPAPPQRIASLSVTADEILVEIVPIERIVAATAAGDEEEHSYAAGRMPPSISRFRRANLERLLSLAPDLVIVSEYTDADFLELLGRSGLRYHRMRGLTSLAGFRRAILELGTAVGEPEAAARLAADFDARLAKVSARLAGKARPRVLYWSDPYTVGGDSAIGALIECGGAVNVGRELALSGLQPLGAERAFFADPDILLVGGTADATALRAHPLLRRMRAVRRGRIVAVPPRQLVTLSQHAAEACAFLAAAFHAERWADEGESSGP